MEGEQFKLNFDGPKKEGNENQDEEVHKSTLDLSQDELDELYKDDHLDQYQSRK